MSDVHDSNYDELDLTEEDESIAAVPNLATADGQDSFLTIEWPDVFMLRDDAGAELGPYVTARDVAQDEETQAYVIAVAREGAPIILRVTNLFDGTDLRIVDSGGEPRRFLVIPGESSSATP